MANTEYDKQYYEANKEKIKARSKAHYEANKATMTEEQKQAKRDTNKRYRDNNPEKMKVQRRKQYEAIPPERFMFYLARQRAKEDSLPFDIEVSDIVIPDVCPILGIPLARSEKLVTDNSPTLDKFVPELGYVKGNVTVVSWRANALKRDGTLGEFVKLVEWMSFHK